MSRVGGKIRVGRVTPIQQFFFFWPYSDQLLGYKYEYKYIYLWCTFVMLRKRTEYCWKIPLKSNVAKKKKKKKGFRVELRAKSNFKSNARGKLRQTIYFFWPKLLWLRTELYSCRVWTIYIFFFLEIVRSFYINNMSVLYFSNGSGFYFW